jgi:hypothetical protein
VVVNSEPATALTASARELWEDLAGAAARFGPVIGVAVSRSRLCPPGWVGIVAIGDDVLATAPDDQTARIVGQALMDQPADAVTGAELLTRRLPAAEILGPAALAYLHPAPSDVIITRLGPDDPHLREFLLAADAGELEESGIQGITTPAFAVREAGRVVAAAGLSRLAVPNGAPQRAHRGSGAGPRLGPCHRVGSRRSRDRRRQAAAVARTARGIPPRGPGPGIPRARLPGEYPAGRGRPEGGRR